MKTKTTPNTYTATNKTVVTKGQEQIQASHPGCQGGLGEEAHSGREANGRGDGPGPSEDPPLTYVEGWELPC